MLISFGVGTMFISDWLCSCPAFTNDVHFSWWRCDVYIWLCSCPIFTGDVHFCLYRYYIRRPGDGRLIINTKFRIHNVDLVLLGPVVLLPRHLNPAPAQLPIRQRVQYGCRRSTNPMERLNSLFAHHAANQIQRCKSAFTLCVWNGQSDDVFERAAVTWATDRVIGCSESRDHGVFLFESRKGQYFNYGVTHSVRNSPKVGRFHCFWVTEEERQTKNYLIR